MRELDEVIVAPRAVVDGEETGCSVGMADGRIAAVEQTPSGLSGARTTVLPEDVVLLPGLVDSHVHVNEPGRAEWEGFAHATRAAVTGGVTTIVDMPLNCVPATTDVAALDAKRAVADGACYCDVAFWGGAVPGNSEDLVRMHASGVVGFKCFLADSGVPEFPPVDPGDLETLMRQVAVFDGLLLVHAEHPAAVSPAPHGRGYADFLASRPGTAEVDAVEAVVAAARRTGCRVHVVHLSSAAALPCIAAARQAGVRLTVETCPHYLTCTAEQVADGATELKCCPPIRDAENGAALWEGLAAGLVDLVASDHSPCPPALKCPDTGDFADAWGGISSLGLALPVVWTRARTRGHSLADLARWMSTAPAGCAGLRRKGRIAEGYDADLCVLAPDETFVVDTARLPYRHPVTPYAGRELSGVVRSTWLAGRPVEPGRPPRGRLLSGASA